MIRHSITQTTTIQALAFDKEGKQSPLLKETFIQVDDNRTIQLLSTYANQYAAGGDNALIDHLRGGHDFRTGFWQGYREDMRVIVDRGISTPFDSIGVGFLQDVQSWIWYPKQVTFYGSEDGESFELLGKKACSFPDNEMGAFTQDFTFQCSKPYTYQYIKIEAQNYGVCPDWHLGAGGLTWIFADEVTIQ